MKKLVLMFALLLSISNVQAQRYNGVAPCQGPDVLVGIATSSIVTWISSGTFGMGGGLLCDVSISTSPEAATDYVYCISSRPVTGAAGTAQVSTAPSTNGSFVAIGNTDDRSLFDFLGGTATVRRALSDTGGFVPVKFDNLACGVSNVRSSNKIYYVLNP